MNQFEVKVLEQGAVKVQISGILNERTEWPEVVADSVKSISIDVDQVASINSLGILGWIRWVGKVQKNYPNIELSISHMRPNFISCASAVKDFLPKNAVIESFYVFYVCDEENQNFYLLKNRAQDYLNGVLTLQEFIEKEVNGSTHSFELSCIPNKDFRCLNVEVRVV